MIVDFSYSYRQPMLYSHFCASTTQSGCLALPTVAITTTAIVYWLILHWSVYYPDHRKRNFAIHINQYNDLTLRIFLSSPCLATKVNETLTSILVSHIASYTISQQGITPSALSWPKTLWWDILFSMFVINNCDLPRRYFAFIYRNLQHLTCCGRIDNCS